MVERDRSVVRFDVMKRKRLSSFSTLYHANLRDWIQRSVSLALSPDETKVAVESVSARGVDLWDPRTGRLLYSLTEQDGTLWWLAWSPDSQRLAVSRSNGDIAIWNLPEIERVMAGLGLSPLASERGCGRL